MGNNEWLIAENERLRKIVAQGLSVLLDELQVVVEDWFVEARADIGLPPGDADGQKPEVEG